MRKSLLFAVIAALTAITLSAQQFTYPQNDVSTAIRLKEADNQKVTVQHTISTWSLSDITINREILKKAELPGAFLPNDEGAPDLPGKGRFVAIPQGATPVVNILRMEQEIHHGVELSPAPRIPRADEDGPLHYEKNPEIWNTNAFYPASPVMLAEPTQVRGLDVVMLGITPFQYNPVTKELIVYHDIEVEVIFQGGSEQFGTDRLRSRWWDPLLKDLVINPSVLPAMDYSSRNRSNRDTGCEYLIVVPDDPTFLAWADTLKEFRNKQGILTDVVTTVQMGGNNVVAMENYFNTAFNTWDIVPDAVLLLGDYGTFGARIIAPIWNNYCVSDNIFSDVNGNSMPDMVFSRITAEDAADLETMVSKILDYEASPPTDPDYYDKPITALGWQTERWFQICIEVVGGFFKNELGKNPVRINEVYEGNPAVDPWSTAPNTGTIMSYFGVNGLGYIPSTPGELGNWDGGNATMINDAINDGSFILLHRDHGWEQGWGEPAYNNNSLNGLSNDELTFVYSVNCLTGKYNWGNESFTEKFHRHQQGALGLVAASEVSYSFVNDTYVWGAFDNMWPEFMPDYGSTPAERGLLPSFSNAAGKYFLQQSNWPYNQNSKEVTYNLFHHHGGAFSTLYSEVPQDLLVLHNGVILGGMTTYAIQADSGALIALSVDGQIIGVEEATGLPVTLSIEPQLPGTVVDLVVTKTNYFRYEEEIPVISPDDPYVIYDDHLLNDEDGDGLMEYAESQLLTLTVGNIGNEDALAVNVKVTTLDPYITFNDSTEFYGDIAANQTKTMTDVFAFDVSGTVPDMHLVLFNVEANNVDTTWNSTFAVTAHAPKMEYLDFTIDDSQGNGNGRLDPGETADFTITFINDGSADAFNVAGELACTDENITVNTTQQTFGDMLSGDQGMLTFSVTASENTPGGSQPNMEFFITAESGVEGYGSFTTVVGKFAALVLDLDPNNNSGPVIFETFSEVGLFAEYYNAFPLDLNDYKSVFLSLGMFYSNHVLGDAEAQRLADYLNNGGNIYMEGRPTWIDDPQTILHGMFNVDIVSDNWFQYENIFGIDNTFTAGMDFGLLGPNPYNKFYFDAVEPAYPVLQSQESSFYCAVANDAGDYKTIASSFEFGLLIEGDSPSTQAELLTGYLDFFGGILTEINDGDLAAGSINLYAFPNPARDETTLAFSLDENTQVSLSVFNMNGQEVARLAEGMMTQGMHRVTWNARDLPEGLYLYRFTAGERSATGKLMLTK